MTYFFKACHLCLFYIIENAIHFSDGMYFALIRDFIGFKLRISKKMPSAVIDRSQLAALFRDHRDDIVGYLLQKVRCPDTAQDLSQEAYLRLLKRDELGHTDNLAGYLFRTAERLAIDFLRADQRLLNCLEGIDETLECPKVQPEQLVILRQQCKIVLDAIAAMPTQCRDVFLLRKIDELSYAEISQKLAISEKTVQRQLVKAMLYCHRRLDLTPFD